MEIKIFLRFRILLLAFTKTIEAGAKEMAQWVMCLPNKHDDVIGPLAPTEKVKWSSPYFQSQQTGGLLELEGIQSA